MKKRYAVSFEYTVDEHVIGAKSTLREERVAVGEAIQKLDCLTEPGAKILGKVSIKPLKGEE